MVEDYFEILGLQEDATPEDIKNAFLKLVKIHHPDKGGNRDYFFDLKNAYEFLSNPDLRLSYIKYRQAKIRNLEFERRQALSEERFNRERNKRLEKIRDRPWWLKLLYKVGLMSKKG